MMHPLAPPPTHLRRSSAAAPPSWHTVLPAHPSSWQVQSRGSCSGEYAAGALPCKNISVSCSTRRSRRFTRSPAVCGREASKRPARFCNLYLSSNSLQSKTYWSACQSQLSSSIVQDMFCCDVCQSQLSSSINLALVSHFGSTCRGGKRTGKEGLPRGMHALDSQPSLGHPPKHPVPPPLPNSAALLAHSSWSLWLPFPLPPQSAKRSHCGFRGMLRYASAELQMPGVSCKCKPAEIIKESCHAVPTCGTPGCHAMLQTRQ